MGGIVQRPGKAVGSRKVVSFTCNRCQYAIPFLLWFLTCPFCLLGPAPAKELGNEEVYGEERKNIFPYSLKPPDQTTTTTITCSSGPFVRDSSCQNPQSVNIKRDKETPKNSLTWLNWMVMLRENLQLAPPVLAQLHGFFGGRIGLDCKRVQSWRRRGLWEMHSRVSDALGGLSFIMGESISLIVNSSQLL